MIPRPIHLPPGGNPEQLADAALTEHPLVQVIADSGAWTAYARGERGRLMVASSRAGFEPSEYGAAWLRRNGGAT